MALATLYGPNGEKKVVTTGTREAASLQTKGWALTPSSKGSNEELTPLASVDATAANAGGELGNLRLAMRGALNEAAKSRVANSYGAVAGVAGGVPGTVGSVVEMIRGSVKPAVETVFSDVLTAFKEQQKKVEFNPDQYRSVQGGVYDLKENKWIINPQDDTPSNSKGGTGSTTTSTTTGGGRTLSRTDVEKLGLPVSLVGTGWTMLQIQFENSNPPNWFRNYTQGKVKMSLTPDALNQAWEEFRTSFNQTYASASNTTNGSSSGGLDYNQF